MPKIADWVVIDVSTSAVGIAVRNKNGEEDHVSVPVEMFDYLGYPATHLADLGKLVLQCLQKLLAKGWVFNQPGEVSAVVRQHDTVVLGFDMKPLMPVLSWRWVGAGREAKELNALGVDKIVGKIEDRFILPKLLHFLRRDVTLWGSICKVMTTGDYISYALTCALSLSTSDGLSNGLLCQETKALPYDVLNKVADLDGIDSPIPWRWFPKPIQSGQKVGKVQHIVGVHDEFWTAVTKILENWTVYAPLGDNHASGVGCGLTDENTIAISGGSSGTIFRVCDPQAKLRGGAACFEYYDRRLLLTMDDDCATWYARFVEERFGSDRSAYARLDADLADFNLAAAYYVPKEVRKNWRGPSDVLQAAASLLFSLGTDFMSMIKLMQKEVLDVPPAENFVFTAGLSRSPFLRRFLFQELAKEYKTFRFLVSTKSEAWADKSTATGGLVNSMLGGHLSRFPEIAAEMCPFKEFRI